MKATLHNVAIAIIPPKKLIEHICKLNNYDDLPDSISRIRSEKRKSNVSTTTDISSLITDDDRNFLKTLDLDSVKLSVYDGKSINDNENLLNVSDLLWLSDKLHKENTYLHELLEGSEIVLPKNDEIPRNKELDARCNRLQIQQDNRAYKAMTKNIDTTMKPLPEDSISYQIKQMNKQLIAVFQFIITVLAGFLFGFHGIELLVGTLDFGFRLLLGVICSLTIALAELYFLAKTLNEELNFEVKVENESGHSKIH